MRAWIDPWIVSRAASLRQQFETAQPFPHLVLDSFLTAEFCERLRREFPAFDAGKALNEFGQIGGKAVREDLVSLGPAYQRFDELMRSRDFLDLVSRLTGIPELLYDPDYVGGGTHDNREGQDLDPHVDFNYHPKRRWHRRLNLILFLNPEWSEEWGGALQLHRNPWEPREDLVRTVVPQLNRSVLFETSERSWHGFKRIVLPADRKDLSRRSIAVYFYTRRRPEAQTAPSHGTFYVQRPLPDHIQAGHTLTQDDVDTIRNLMARRDQQVRFLYQREVQYSAILEAMTRTWGFYVRQVLKWPLRRWRARRQAGAGSAAT